MTRVNYDDTKAAVLSTLVPARMSAYTVDWDGDELHYLVASVVGGQVSVMIIEPTCGFTIMSVDDWWKLENSRAVKPMTDECRAKILAKYGYTLGRGRLTYGAWSHPMVVRSAAITSGLLA